LNNRVTIIFAGKIQVEHLQCPGVYFTNILQAAF
jgi:hypothetical protein